MNTTRRITCGLVTATFGALGLGALNGQPVFGVATVILGGEINSLGHLIELKKTILSVQLQGRGQYHTLYDHLGLLGLADGLKDDSKVKILLLVYV